MKNQDDNNSFEKIRNRNDLVDTFPDAGLDTLGAPVGSRLSRNDDARLFRKIATDNLEHLTVRQNQVLDLILAGRASKNIAFDLNISQRTVENHRAAIAQRIGAHSLADLVHTAVCGRCAISEQDASHCDNALVISTIGSPAGELTSEDLVRLDMREVSHRLKNFAAIIQSICHQTARSAKSVIEFEGVFSARLSAFCSSLDALVAGAWSNLSMNQLVVAQLAPFGLLDSDQISVSGPDLILKPAAAHAIGMALHELATNAVKYGSLSVVVGRVTFDWHVQQHELVLNWRESNGPAVVKPLKGGFGQQVIQKLTALALQGTVEHQYLTGGVHWKLRCDADNSLSPGAKAGSRFPDAGGIRNGADRAIPSSSGGGDRTSTRRQPGFA